MKPRVRILLPVWGADYIASFQSNGLRSLLAPNNLPAMASRCDLEFAILTPDRDRPLFTANPLHRRLEQVCTVTFVDIEDLLIDNSLYGYILTYAYHRGIRDVGDRLTDTHFVFIVGDYVFSENAFDSLSRLIAAGNDVILSGSLRVDSEIVGRRLAEFGRPDEPLAVPARQVLDIALRDLHPSLAAKVVNRPPGSGFSSNYQHFYWQVDAGTVFSRNFMSHMLCIKPNHCPPVPRGFCDYTFIPDMAADVPFAWLDDSDDFFAMELQHRDHEAVFTQPGDRVVQHVAGSLSSWTTAQHRGFADHTFVFHAGEIPPTLDAVEREADRFIADVKAHLSPEPKSHLCHPHWDPICEMIVERAQERWRRRRAQPAGTPKFNFAMQVWGKRYIDVLLDVGLPSQLSTGNLETFPWLDTSVYEIYTTRADAQRLRSSQIVRWLQVLMEVKFIYIDDQLTTGKWSNVRYCHQQAVKSADAREAALFFLCPDQIWPDGSIVNAARLIAEDGYSAVMCPGPRAIEEDMVPLLRGTYLSADETSLTISARDLVKAGLDHFHPEMVEWLWDDPEYFGYPSYMMFDVPGQGVLAQCYILHPVVVNPQVRGTGAFNVFDQDYLTAAIPDVSRIYVAQDSDTVFHFELSPRNVGLPESARPYRPDPELELMWYGERQFNAHHRAFAKLPIRIHYTDILPDRWRPVERRAEEIIARIDRGWDIPDWLLAYRHPDHLIRRIEARYRFDPNGPTPEDAHLVRRAKEILTARRGGGPDLVGAVAPQPARVGERLSGVTRRLARTAGVPMPDLGRRIAPTSSGALVALGQDRDTAPLLTAGFNHVASAEAGGGLLLPCADPGMNLYIHNDTAHPIRIYASGLDLIDHVPGAAGLELPAHAGCVMTAVGADLWSATPLDDAALRISPEERATRFDPEHYLRVNPDVAESGQDPETHYRTYGWKEGRDPSPYFDVKKYLYVNSDVREAGLEPLAHFRVYGIAGKRVGWEK